MPVDKAGLYLLPSSTSKKLEALFQMICVSPCRHWIIRLFCGFAGWQIVFWPFESFPCTALIRPITHLLKLVHLYSDSHHCHCHLWSGFFSKKMFLELISKITAGWSLVPEMTSLWSTATWSLTSSWIECASSHGELDVLPCPAGLHLLPGVARLGKLHRWRLHFYLPLPLHHTLCPEILQNTTDQVLQTDLTKLSWPNVPTAGPLVVLFTDIGWTCHSNLK